jgi:hypothetical protein
MAEITITDWTTRDVRFPTSLDKTGSDAMNAAGDYSAAYCILQTDSEYSGHGMVSYFTSHLHYPSSHYPAAGFLTQYRLSPSDAEMIPSATLLLMLPIA